MSAFFCRCWVVLCALALLAGCATQPARLPTQRSDELAQQRFAALDAWPNWQLTGRAVLSNGQDQGSGRLSWTQRGAHYSIRLTAPVSGRSWTLTGDGTHSQMEGGEHGAVRGSDPQVLLRQETGWTVPFEAVTQWVRGRPWRVHEAQYAVDGQGRLLWLEEAGWRVEYRAWSQWHEGLWLPRRLLARSGSHQLRVAVDRWDGNDP